MQIKSVVLGATIATRSCEVESNGSCVAGLINHFIFAELDSGGDEQNLKLVFTTHEISVRGHHLRRIETVMQRLELSLLAKLPGSQRKLITEGQPVVLEIKVTEAKDAEKEAK